MKRTAAILAVALMAMFLMATGRVDPEDQLTRGMKVSLGRYGDSHPPPVHKFGRNSNVDTGTTSNIWACGVLNGAQGLYPWPTLATPQTLYVSSSDDTDDEDLEVQGLDANWELQTDTVTVDGFTAVALSGTWRRVFRAKNVDPDQLSFSGNVYIHIDSDPGADGIPDTDTDTVGCVTGLNNQTLMALYTIPEPYTGLLKLVCFGVNKKQDTVVDFTLRFRENANPLPFQTKLITGASRASGKVCQPYDPPRALPARTDIDMLGSASANDSDAFTTFTIELVA